MSYYTHGNRGYGIGGLSLKTLENEISQLFGNLPTLLDFSDFGPQSNSRAATKAAWFESDAAFEGRLDLPGVKNKDVEVEIEGRSLKVKAVRKKEGGAESADVEYGYTQLLPEGIDGEAVSARMEDGVLSLRIPKLAKAQPRKIEIN